MWHRLQLPTRGASTVALFEQAASTVALFDQVLSTVHCLTGTHWFYHHRLLDVIHMVILTHIFRRKPAAATLMRLLFFDKQQGIFYMHFSIDRTVHTTAFDEPVVDHWLERKIAQTAAGSTEKDRSDDRTLGSLSPKARKLLRLKNPMPQLRFESQYLPMSNPIA